MTELGEGAAMLDAVEAFVTRFVAFPSSHAAVAVTLWATHTHLVERFDSTPRLALLSAEKQSGKSRTLEVLELLCRDAEMLSDASPPWLFRRIAAGPVTILLDEVDAIWHGGKGNETTEALRSIVNAGHRRRASVGRVEMTGQTAELRRYAVYAPAVLAGIGNLPDTILDRSVIVRMRRRAPEEHVDQYRERTCAPAGHELRGRLSAWADSIADQIGEPWPVMPEGVTDRPADVWEPLLAVAQAAGGRWPDLAREACVAFVTGSKDDTATVGVRLLADLREIFVVRDEKRKPVQPPAFYDVLAGEQILAALHALDESPWADYYGKPLDPRGLAKILKRYGIRPKVVRIGDATPRGYAAADLAADWTRYLPPVSATGSTSATPLIRPVADVARVADTQEALHASSGADTELSATPCRVCQALISITRWAAGNTTCATHYRDEAAA